MRGASGERNCLGACLHAWAARVRAIETRASQPRAQRQRLQGHQVSRSLVALRPQHVKPSSRCKVGMEVREDKV